MSILVFGSINMDLISYVARLPRPGETLFGRSYLTAPGGKGANQAVAAARLGAVTVMVGRVGNDAFGRELLPILKAENIDTSGILIDNKHGTGLAVISVDDSGENAITVISGANMTMDESDLVRCLPLLNSSRVLMLQLEVPVDISIEAARAARERGKIVILDPAPAEQLPPRLYPLIDILTPNEVETEVLTGIRPTDALSAARAAEMLRSRGVKTAVIKMGAQGSHYASDTHSGHMPAFPAIAVDTVAAGDSFNGALAVALSEGSELPEAVRWASAAASISVTRHGAQPSMPRRDELIRILEL